MILKSVGVCFLVILAGSDPVVGTRPDLAGVNETLDAQSPVSWAISNSNVGRDIELANNSTSGGRNKDDNKQERRKPFLRMHSVWDFVIFYYLLANALFAQAFAELVRTNEKLIQKNKVTALGLLKINLSDKMCWFVSMKCFVTMYRLLVYPFSLAAGVVIIIVEYTIGCQMMGIMCFFFVLKILLVKRPGLVESYSPRILTDRIMLLIKLVSILPNGAMLTHQLINQPNDMIGAIFLSNLHLEATSSSSSEENDESSSSSSLPAPLIFILVVLVITMVSALVETIINYQTINLKKIKYFLINLTLGASLIIMQQLTIKPSEDNDKDDPYGLLGVPYSMVTLPILINTNLGFLAQHSYRIGQSLDVERADKIDIALREFRSRKKGGAGVRQKRSWERPQRHVGPLPGPSGINTYSNEDGGSSSSED